MSDHNEPTQSGALPSVPLQPVVRLSYGGQPWTAKRLKTTNYIQFQNESSQRDGMMWSVPDDSVIALDWRIRHAGHIPSREELFNLLAVVDSYRSLLIKPTSGQRAIARTLREFLKPNPKLTVPRLGADTVGRVVGTEIQGGTK